MAVHAHPDDEAIGTGGILARYSPPTGVRTVLVTCTNGELGDAPGGIKPGDPGTTRVVVPLRRKELEASCRGPRASPSRAAGVPRLGHGGLAAERRARLVLATPVPEAGHRLAELMRQYRPQVVVTYDENGFYGHPDHIQANRITHAAMAECGIPDQAVLHRHGPLALRGFPRRVGRGGMEPPRGRGEPRLRDAGRAHHDDDRLQRPSPRKYASLAAHASQSDNIFFLRWGRSSSAPSWATRASCGCRTRPDSPVPEDDLFAGLR
jgi:LmbE family N-acetylglucosaminyl deacetylase